MSSRGSYERGGLPAQEQGCLKALGPYTNIGLTYGPKELTVRSIRCQILVLTISQNKVAAVAEWLRYRIVAGLVTSSSPVPLKTGVGERCTLSLSRVQMSTRWCSEVVRRGGTSSGVVHVT
ncbi:uncharacterized protein TNCV_1694911 [Trichonephila clavipes]|nr:uncharacterized protein TNCV_1694911 [Trichonephila clavipes]